MWKRCKSGGGGGTRRRVLGRGFSFDEEEEPPVAFAGEKPVAVVRPVVRAPPVPRPGVILRLNKKLVLQIYAVTYR